MSSFIERRVLGSDSSEGPAGWVRKVDFSTPEDPGTRSRCRKTHVSGPSGHLFAFKQQGRPTNPCSKWLPVHDERDYEHFEQRDGFEVRREDP